MRRPFQRSAAVVWAPILAAWGLSWLFARDIVRGLESLGVLPRRGIVFSDASDFVFSLFVLAVLLFGWAVVRGAKRSLAREAANVAAPVHDDDVHADDLVRQKDALLRELKDLDLDRQMRKVGDADYALIEARLRREATDVLRALDALDPAKVYESRIDADLRSFLAARSTEPPSETPAAASPNASFRALDEADQRWRDEVLARPGHPEMASLLGERDVLLAALGGFAIESVEIDRSAPNRSTVSVVAHGNGARATYTLEALRERVAASLANADERSVERAARLGVSAGRAP